MLAGSLHPTTVSVLQTPQFPSCSAAEPLCLGGTNPRHAWWLAIMGYRDSNGDLYRVASRPTPYSAGGDGDKGLSQVGLERLAYVPCLPEVLRGECRRSEKAVEWSGRARGAPSRRGLDGQPPPTRLGPVQTIGQAVGGGLRRSLAARSRDILAGGPGSRAAILQVVAVLEQAQTQAATAVEQP